MTIAQIGTLPVSGVNLGLVASLPALTAEIDQLTLDLSRLGVALEAQVTFGLNLPPNITAYLSQFALNFDVSVLVSSFNPTNWVTLNADANVELVVELGLIDAKLAVVAAIDAELSAGLDTGSLTAWTYAGNARGFGTELKYATQNGFGSVAPTADINAIIIGCEDFSSWENFGASFNIGTSADEDLGTTSTQQDLLCLGTLTGGQLNTGVLELYARLRLFLLELQGLRAAVLAQIDLSLGLNLPDPQVIIDAGLEIDLDLAMDNLVNIQVDIAAQLEGIQLKIDLLLELIAEISAQLSGGGLTVWSYSGPAGLFGSEFAPEIINGMPGASGPGATVYGLVIACAFPAAWASFGNIMITG